jgi:hypothetical protein
VGLPPEHSAVPGGHLDTVFDQPQQSLAHASEFQKFVEHPSDRQLHALIRVFLQALVRGLEVSDGGDSNELSARRLLPSCLQRALPQEIEFVLAEATF